jgi:hypothetical protein
VRHDRIRNARAAGQLEVLEQSNTANAAAFDLPSIAKQYSSQCGGVQSALPTREKRRD